MSFEVAVDLDGVLAESLKAFCRLYSQRCGASLTLDELRRWDFYRELSLSEEEFLELLDEAWADWRDIPPTEPGLADRLAVLCSVGIAFDVVTCRSQGTMGFAKRWLDWYGIPYRRLVRAKNPREKLRLNYDVYIDDSPELARLIGSIGSGRAMILFLKPWNSHLPLPQNVFPARDWEEAQKILIRLARL